jgi:hypothetical protein
MRHLSSRSKNWILILGTAAWLVAVIVQFQLPSDSLWGQLLNVINLVLAVALIISGVGRLFWQRVERQRAMMMNQRLIAITWRQGDASDVLRSQRLTEPEA